MSGKDLQTISDLSWSAYHMTKAMSELYPRRKRRCKRMMKECIADAIQADQQLKKR